MPLCSNGWEKYGDRFSDGYTEEDLSTLTHRFYEYGDDAGCFIEDYPGVWGSHYLCNSRGAKALKATTEVLKDFFNNEDAKIITGLIKTSNKPAKIMTRKVGFTSLGEVLYEDGDYELFILFKKDFMDG